MKSLVLCAAVSIMMFVGGCPMYSVMTTPGPYENTGKAEYELGKKAPKRLLVLVEQPAAIRSDVNLQMYITKLINSLLVAKVKLDEESLVPYQELARYRQEHPDFSSLTPVEAGKALKADMVLYVTITNYKLANAGESDYNSMELALKTGLYDTSSGNMVWPEDDLRTIQLAVELGSGSKDKVAAQLSQAAARCVVRYLYGCPRLEFQVPEEVKDLNAQW